MSPANLLICLSFLAQTQSAGAVHEPAALVVSGGKVLDTVGDSLLDGRVILIEHGRIAAVGTPAEVGTPPGARIFDATGLTIIPGLIDLHTHLLLHPYDEASWNDQVLKESLELRTLRAAVAARATVQAGFTTIRDLGTEGAGYADVALRDAVAMGLIPGPRIVTTTRAIVATGCYGPTGFDPRWPVPQGADEATGADELRRVVRRQIAAGADWIKFYADFHRRPDAPATPTFSEDEMKVIVDEARSASLRVAAHATTSEGIRRAVLAGVATIEHGYEASDEALSLIRERGVVLCPTLAAAEAYARYRGWKPGEPEPAELKRTKQTFARALRAGVRIACGSDAGVFAHGDNVREIELMVECGMSPAAALKAATRIAADVLERRDLGRIEPRAVADLVMVRGDPLHDVAALRRPVIVIKDGRVVLASSPSGAAP